MPAWLKLPGSLQKCTPWCGALLFLMLVCLLLLLSQRLWPSCSSAAVWLLYGSLLSFVTETDSLISLYLLLWKNEPGVCLLLIGGGLMQ